MGGISTLKQPLQIHFAELYSEARHGTKENKATKSTYGTMGTKPVNSTFNAATDANQVLLENDDHHPSCFGECDILNTVLGLFKALIDAGIQCVTLIINQMYNEDEAGLPRDGTDRSNTISQGGILDSDTANLLKSLSTEDTKLFKDILNQLELNKYTIAVKLLWNKYTIAAKHFPDEEGDVILHSFNADRSLDEVNIVVRKGGIYITYLGQELELMPAEEYFSIVKHNLINLDLSLLDMTGQDLSDMRLCNVNLVGVNFHGARFRNTSITLNLPEFWYPSTLDIYLNHLGNTNLRAPDVYDHDSGLIHQLYFKKPKNCSLLTAINSINDKYEIKIELMRQVIISLKKTNISCVRDAMKAIFESNPNFYMKDTRIKAFIIKNNLVDPAYLPVCKKRHVKKLIINERW